MNDMTTAEEGVPTLPDADYLFGIGGGRRHAISYMAARDGCDRAAVLDAAGYGRAVWALPVCADGPGAVPVSAWLGAFESTEGPGGPARPTVCGACAWAVAAARGRLGEELQAQRPVGTDRIVLRETLGDPDLLVALCKAVLLADENLVHVAHECAVAAANDGDADAWALLTRPAWEVRGPHGPATPSPETLQRLAHLRDHTVGVSYPMACLEGDCGHHQRPELMSPDGRHCCAAEAFVHCAGCSMAAGGWAGEHEGALLLDVPGPCSVLVAAGAQLGVPVPSRSTARSVPVARTEERRAGD